jgi:hypothetical protein
MIVSGSSRGGASQLGSYLFQDKNEQVEVLSIDRMDIAGRTEADLTMALLWMEAYASQTRSPQNGLYHCQISPEAHESLTDDQWLEAVDRVEEQLGFEEQGRAIVLHEKDGRRHAHVVWQRTDTTGKRWKLKSDSWDYVKHETAARLLEHEFGHPLVPGKYDQIVLERLRSQGHEAAAAALEREMQAERTPSGNSYTFAEQKQAERSAERSGELMKPNERKALIRSLYEKTDTGQAFIAALEAEGFIVARGNRGAVIVDRGGEIHALRPLKTKEVKQRLVDVELAHLPEAEQTAAEVKARCAEQKQVPEIEAEPVSLEKQPEPEKEPEAKLAFDHPDREALTAEIEAIDRKIAALEDQEARIGPRPDVGRGFFDHLSAEMDLSAEVFSLKQDRENLEARLRGELPDPEPAEVAQPAPVKLDPEEQAALIAEARELTRQIDSLEQELSDHGERPAIGKGVFEHFDREADLEKQLSTLKQARSEVEDRLTGKSVQPVEMADPELQPDIPEPKPERQSVVERRFALDAEALIEARQTVEFWKGKVEDYTPLMRAQQFLAGELSAADFLDKDGRYELGDLARGVLEARLARSEEGIQQSPPAPTRYPSGEKLPKSIQTAFARLDPDSRQEAERIYQNWGKEMTPQWEQSPQPSRHKEDAQERMRRIFRRPSEEPEQRM